VLNAPLRIVVVDDEELVHRDVERFERKAKRWKLRCFLNPAEALQQIPIDHPDVVLLDTDMPGINGIDCARMLKAVLPSLPVILLAPRVNHATVSGYHQVGAHGLRSKPLTAEVLIEAVAGAVRGLHTVCSEAAEILATLIPARTASAGHPLLTERECQIMDRVVQGWGDKEIGAALGISPTTVHAHRTNSYRRLGARGRSDAVSRFLQRGEHSYSPRLGPS
jgi:DNA-binding NarL/FixJ family response regulator